MKPGAPAWYQEDPGGRWVEATVKKIEGGLGHVYASDGYRVGIVEIAGVLDPRGVAEFDRVAEKHPWMRPAPRPRVAGRRPAGERA